MKQIIALGLLLGIAACNQPVPERTMELAKPTLGADGKLAATFTVNIATTGDRIASLGSGGACWVADLNIFGIPAVAQNFQCTEESQCNDALSQAHKDAGWYSYCGSGGKCWTRPGPQAIGVNCKISPGDPWPDGIPQDMPALSPYVPLEPSVAKKAVADRTMVQWALTGCLNGVDDKGNPPAEAPCKNKDDHRELKSVGPSLAVLYQPSAQIGDAATDGRNGSSKDPKVGNPPPGTIGNSATEGPSASAVGTIGNSATDGRHGASTPGQIGNSATEGRNGR